MNKIKTLFVRDQHNMRLVLNQYDPDFEWILKDEGRPTQKRDGTNIQVTIKKRKIVDVKKRRNPSRAEKAQGAEPGYVPANRSDPNDQYIFAAVDATDPYLMPDGEYSCEALGPKIQGGVESNIPCLYFFTVNPLILLDVPKTFDGIRRYTGIARIADSEGGVPMPVEL